jgi:hypothetical protein
MNAYNAGAKDSGKLDAHTAKMACDFAVKWGVTSKEVEAAIWNMLNSPIFK